MEGMLMLLAGALAAGGGVLLGLRLGRRGTPAPRGQAAGEVDGRLAAILANIELYDGTAEGQRPVEEEDAG